MAIVKRLTGGEEICAQHMRAESFTFEPACKLPMQREFYADCCHPEVWSVRTLQGRIASRVTVSTVMSSS